MAQYIDKDALVAEIKRRKELVSDPILSGNDLMIGERNAYFNLLSFIDSLQEEPVDKCKGCNNVRGCITCVDGDQWAHYKESGSEDLEEAAEDYGIRQGAELKPFAIKYFKAGAKWKEQQITAKAIDGRLYSTICGSEQYIAVPAGYGEYGKDGDKVKVVILKDG